MADESIVIKFVDGIAPSIAKKIAAIGSEAKAAKSSIESLKSALAGLSSSGLARMQAELSSMASAQKTLATELGRTKTSVASLSSEQTKAAIGAQRLAQAQSAAAAAAAKSQTAQANLATATARTATAQAQSATAAQRLATEVQRTAVQTANAAAASDRAAAAALRLEQAQGRAAKQTNTLSSGLMVYSRAALAAAGAGVGAAAATLGAGSMAETYTVLQNKLQIVSESQAQMNQLTEELFAVASRSRSGIEATVTSFSRFDRALRILGKSQQDSLTLTETINKALIVSGATPKEAESSLLQLSQAFNSGRLQGEEFKAVSESMPLILDALAEATGKPVQEMKKLSSEGGISADLLYKAFSLLRTQVDKTFGDMTPTIGQSLSVLRNSAIKFFGEINKSLGITAGIATATLAIANNFDKLAIASLAVGAGMAYAFSPAIITAIGAVTKGVAKLTVLMAANPMALLVGALVGAVAYLVMFRNELTIGIDKTTTLGNFATAVFDNIAGVIQQIKGDFSSMFDSSVAIAALSGLSAAWAEAASSILSSISGWTSAYDGFYATTRTGFSALLTGAARTTDAIGGLFRGLMLFVGKLASIGFSKVTSEIAKSYNDAASKIEEFANAAIERANKIRAALGKEAIGKLELPKMADGGAGAGQFKSIGEAWRASLEEGFKGQGDSAQGLLDGLLASAKTIGDASGQKKDNLRGDGTSSSLASQGGGAAAATERRATALARINAELNNELARMRMLRPERDAQERFDRIQEQLISKRVGELLPKEAQAIRDKIAAIYEAKAAQEAADRIYDEAIGPLKEYNANIAASKMLLDQKKITLQQYNDEIGKSAEAYRLATDPTYQYTKTAVDGIQSMFGPLNQAKYDVAALGAAFDDEIITLELYRQKVAAIGTETASVLNAVGKSDFSSVMLQSMDSVMEGFVNLTYNTAALIGETFNSLADGISDSIGQAIVYGESFSESMRSISQQVMAELISGLVKVGIQYLINKKLADSSLASSVVSNAAAAAATAAAWKPAATMASLATSGGNAVGAKAGMLSTSALAALLAKPGFKEGGYTGSGAVDKIAGVVHGKEFVMDARSTSRIGVASLRALQRGAASVQQNQGRAGSAAQAAAAPAASAAQQSAPPPVNMTAIVVQTKDAALAAIKTAEGRAFIMETIEQNGATVARIVGAR